MTAEIKVLARPQEPEVIQYLEELLAKARTGEVNGILIVAQSSSHVHHYYAGIKDRASVLGYLSIAMHRLQDA